MTIPRELLLSLPKIKARFAAFGAVVVPEFFSPTEMVWIGREFDRELDHPGLKPQFADDNPKLAKLIDHPAVNVLVSALLGTDWLYKGSDGNVFAGSTPWHRDYLIETRTLKLLTYLDGSTLDFIPGSHFPHDEYAGKLGEALTWPEPPSRGGFDEKRTFGNDDVPFVRLKADPGDVIAFSHNVIHRAVEPNRSRRLLGLHFAEAFNDEIRQLTLIEMRQLGCGTCYGKHVRQSARTEGFFDLRTEAAKFNGKYDRQSSESVEFGKRLLNAYPPLRK